MSYDCTTGKHLQPPAFLLCPFHIVTNLHQVWTYFKYLLTGIFIPFRLIVLKREWGMEVAVVIVVTVALVVVVLVVVVVVVRWRWWSW